MEKRLEEQRDEWVEKCRGGAPEDSAAISASKEHVQTEFG